MNIPDNIEALIAAHINKRPKKDHSTVAAFMCCMEAMSNTSAATFAVTIEQGNVTVTCEHPMLETLTFSGRDAADSFDRAMAYFATLNNTESPN